MAGQRHVVGPLTEDVDAARRLTVLIYESVQSYALSENCVWSDAGSKSHCEAVDTI
jgi:hypothetical protein